jgi:hypothetical protein
MKKYFLLFALLFSSIIFSQNVNDYKYIVLPAKFSFLKEANKYNLNALTKSVLEKQGYEVYYDTDIFPQDLAENRCKALFADMLENSSLFVTKIKLELKDCKNQTVYVSKEGKSREKEYAKAYVQAFREVGKSLSVLKSNPKQQVPEKAIEMKTENTVAATLFFAQPIPNGFQIVDTTPKVVMKLFKTSVSDFYIAQKDNQQGVFLNKNNQWYFEYYQNDKLVSEKMEIKF